MTNERIDVLSDLDEVIARNEANADCCSITGPNAAMHNLVELQAIRVAVAELIAADNEHDDALVNLATINREIAERGWVALEADALRKAGERFSRAVIRRDRALARVTGAGKLQPAPPEDENHENEYSREHDRYAER